MVNNGGKKLHSYPTQTVGAGHTSVTDYTKTSERKPKARPA